MHARLLCPSLSTRVCSNSCPSSQWCHPTISSSVAPFSSCPQPFLLSGSFPKSHFFASGGQKIGASVSVLLMNIQGWFPLGLTGLISMLSKGLSRVLLHQNSKVSVLWCSVFFTVQLSHPYITTGKTIALTIWTLVVVSLCKEYFLKVNCILLLIIKEWLFFHLKREKGREFTFIEGLLRVWSFLFISLNT